MPRTLRSFIPVALMALCSCATFALDEKPLSAPEILPEGTILYAELAPWKQWSADFNRTALAAIAADPDIRTFIAGPFAHISKMLERKDAAPVDPNAPKAPEGNVFFDLMGRVAPGPFTVGLRYAQEDELAKRQPAWAFIAGINDDDKTLETKNNNILGLLDSVLRDSKVEVITVTEYQGGKLLTIKPGNLKTAVTLVLHKNRLIASSDVEFCKQIMDGMAGTLTRKLSQSAIYKSTGMNGSEHLGAYMDIAGMQKALGTAERGGEGRLEEIFALAGLDKAGTVAWSLKMNGPAFESRTAIFSKGERVGLIGALDEEPLSADALKMLPANTPFAAGFRLKKERLLSLLRGTFKAAQGQKGVENFDAAVKQLSVDGHDLDTDLKAAFGGELILASLSGTEISGGSNVVPAFVASLLIADPKKAEETLERLLKQIAIKMDPAGDAANVLKEVDAAVKIRYLAPKNAAGLLGVSPAFALQENRLLVAFDVPSLKKALRFAREGGGLATSEKFKTALEGVGGKMGPMFTYVDYGQIFKTAFNVTTSAVRLIAPNDMLKAAGVDMNLLPETEAVTNHLFPAMSVAHLTPAGVVMMSRSPLPSMEVLTPPLAALTAIYASFGAKKE